MVGRGADRRRPPDRLLHVAAPGRRSRSASRSTACRCRDAELERRRRATCAASSTGCSRGRPAAGARRRSSRWRRPRRSSCSAARGVDVAVLEVGLGGRLDATNVATPRRRRDHEHRPRSPAVSRRARSRPSPPRRPASSSPGMRLVCGERRAGAARRHRRRVPRRGARRSCDACDGVDAASAAIGGRRDDDRRCARRRGAYGPVTLALRGRHQVANALVAVRLLEALSDAPGVRRARRRRSSAGLRDARLARPARLASSRRTGARVLLDAAHNPAGAATLAAYLREAVPGRALPLVFGAVRDKDHAGMLRALLPCVRASSCSRRRRRRARPTPRTCWRVARGDRSRPRDVSSSSAIPSAALDAAWASRAATSSSPGSIFLLGAVRAGAARARAAVGADPRRRGGWTRSSAVVTFDPDDTIALVAAWLRGGRAAGRRLRRLSRSRPARRRPCRASTRPGSGTSSAIGDEPLEAHRRRRDRRQRRHEDLRRRGGDLHRHATCCSPGATSP